MFTIETNADLARVTIYDARGNQLQQFVGPVSSLATVRERLILQGYVKVSNADVAKCCN